MKKDLEQGKTVIAEMLKSMSSLKSPSSTITRSTISLAKSQSLQTIKSKEHNSSTPFLDKQKESKN